jgi:peptide-O-fucosyltransferase
MGRLGNQIDHFLGSMSFAKQLNRTLVVPPFRTYKNVPYKEWFKLEKLSEFHRVISAEDFMLYIAPRIWPTEKRYGYCWLPSHMIDANVNCQMMNGNPSENFWSELAVLAFSKSIAFSFDIEDFAQWRSQFPPQKHPVIALKGAPANYPVRSYNRINQKYMILSDEIESQVSKYINETFRDEPFVGIHLRNGEDWINACQYLDGMSSYMSSPQCFGDFYVGKIEIEVCFPSKSTILTDLENLLIAKLNKTVKNVYIATDKSPMIKEIREHFSKSFNELNLVHHDPWLPLVDLAILARSEFFMGNCISSFTSYVKRERDIHGRESSFWAFKDKI